MCPSLSRPSHFPTPLATGSAIYDPGISISKTCRLPNNTDVLTSELHALYQAQTHLTNTYSRGQAVIYTASLSSLHLLLSRHPSSSKALVLDIQRHLFSLTTLGWDITFHWVPSHSGIRGNKVIDACLQDGSDGP